MAFFPPFFPKVGEATTPYIRPKYILFKTINYSEAQYAFELNAGDIKISKLSSEYEIPWADDYAILPWVTDTQMMKSSTSTVTQAQGGAVNQKRMAYGNKVGGFVTGSWTISGEVTPIPYSDDHIDLMTTYDEDGVNTSERLPLVFQIIQQAMRLMDDVEGDPNAQLVLYSLQEGEYWYVQPMKRDIYRRAPDRVGWRYEFTFEFIEKAKPPKLTRTYNFITDNRDWFEKMMDAINKGIKYAQAAVAWCKSVVKKIGQYANRILGAFQKIADLWTSISGLVSDIFSAPENLTLWARGWVDQFITGWNEIEDSFNDMVSFFQNYTDYWDFSEDGGSDDSDSGDIDPSENGRLVVEIQECMNGTSEAISEAVVGIRMALSETIKGRTGRIISVGDTLEGIAMEIYGDKSYAAKIAEWNNLTPPYFSKAGIPGTLRPGQMIYYPYSITGASGTLAPIDGTFIGETNEMLYGRGLKLIRTVGHPWRGDIKISADRNGTDEIYGSECVEQGLWVRMQTTYGKDQNFPYVGLPEAIGQITDVTAQAMINAATSWQIKADSRVESIASLNVDGNGEELKIDASVNLVSSAEQASLGVTL